MSPYVAPVISSETLPEAADVVIIGGGIIGASAAWHLARRGISVALCEKGVIGGEQSSRNWGYCRQQGRDPAELPLIRESMRQWETMATDLGEDVGYRCTGVHYLAADAAGMKRFEDFMPHARTHGLDTRLLSKTEAAEALPGAARVWAGGMVTPSDGRAEPALAAPAIARAAQRAGAAVLTNCAVRGLERAAGRISGVVTERGTIATQTVLLAGGAWSSLFCRSLGIDLPQLTVRSSVMRTRGGPDVTHGGAWTPKFALRRRLDGGCTIAHGGLSSADITADSFRYFLDFLPILKDEWRSTRLAIGRRFLESLKQKRTWALDAPTVFEDQRVLDPRPVAATLEAAWRDLVAVLPDFANVEIAERWAGYIDTTPDAVPVISPVASLPGFFIATGFSGHGFGIGPGAGRLAGEVVIGAEPCVDPAPFALSRLRGARG
ncbi:glycine/D-amino acid oxidase-like deaminating enzyme [Breoghania corrubedonensis]|uniref:Glycine/D-amino acid oxidase-like deaminating enzyme n=1 Tax=Breoghania corrubedonensis TaxID=665038 RepID=A0A2T5V4Z8_9HYPH|nr:FAD-binding oxidoreductase [Breoghania corrubedonensis]PTW58832.1 glycine/D-amino acid oxidase-like deaminating enzyme [Breoghania corrubedonensis]